MLGCKLRGSNVTEHTECSRRWQYSLCQRLVHASACLTSLNASGFSSSPRVVGSPIPNVSPTCAKDLSAASIAAASVCLAMAYSAACLVRYICSSYLEAVPRPVGTSKGLDQLWGQADDAAGKGVYLVAPEQFIMAFLSKYTFRELTCSQKPLEIRGQSLDDRRMTY